MPDINLLKNTEKYDPSTPKPPPPPGPGPLSDPELESTGLLSTIRSWFNRRGKSDALPVVPTMGQSVGSGGHMNLEKAGRSDRILAEHKSKPTMIKLPEDDEGGFSINLLGQDVGRSITLREQIIRLAMVAAGSIVLVGLVYGGLVLYSGTISSEIDDAQQKITELQTTITDLETKQADILATTKKIAAIRSLIDRHVYWSKFFHQLEQVTGPDVFFGPSFTGDLSGGVVLSARTGSFDAVATQYLFFQQAVKQGGFIRSFNITGAAQQITKSGAEVTFTVTLVLVPEVFFKTAEEVTATTTPTPVDGTQPTETVDTNSSTTP